MTVNQILILDNINQDARDLVEKNKDRFKQYYPNEDYKIWYDEEIKDFIKDNFGQEILQDYITLKPYCYKSDLARFCILYKNGGIYYDIHNKPMTKNIPGYDLIAFRDDQRNGRNSWGMQTSVIVARTSGNDVFERTILKISENVKNRYYGISALDPTGPQPFGKAFADHGVDGNHWIGDFRHLTPGYDIKNYGFILPDGEIFALSKNHGAGDINLSGSNNYSDMWVARDVYL